MTSDGLRLVALDNEGLHIWSTNGDQLLASGFERQDRDVATSGARGKDLVGFRVGDANIGFEAIRCDTTTGLEGNAPPGDRRWALHNGAGDLISLRTTGPRGFELIDPVTYEPVTPFVDAPTWASIESSPDGQLIAIG